MSFAALPRPQLPIEHRPAMPSVVPQRRGRRVSDLNDLLRVSVPPPGAILSERRAAVPEPGIYTALRFCSVLYGASALLGCLLYELWLCAR